MCVLWLDFWQWRHLQVLMSSWSLTLWNSLPLSWHAVKLVPCQMKLSVGLVRCCCVTVGRCTICLTKLTNHVTALMEGPAHSSEAGLSVCLAVKDAFTVMWYDALLLVLFFPCDAVHKHGIGCRVLSVHPSVTFFLSKRVIISSELFHPRVASSHAILAFRYETLQQYSDGEPPNWDLLTGAKIMIFNHWLQETDDVLKYNKLEGHSVERMYLRQRCFDGSTAQWIKPC